jgi:serine/threonine-protein kinase
MWSGANIAGRQLLGGKYRVLTELGHGGMADLYLAVSEGPAGFSKLIVVKRLRNGEDPQHVAMFLDEARLAARLSHPNIVATHEICEQKGSHFIVMEHLPGPTVQQLRQRYAPQGRIPAAIELEIMCNVLEGLHYAHELRSYDGKPLQVVHRDLSPENVIVTLLGECKIFDFGIAKTLDSLTQTQAGFYKGKLTKMPPEQLLGEPIDRRADVFAAGVMLWEGLSGRSLWGDLGAPAIAHCLAARDIPPLSATGADVPEELMWLCARAIHVEPDGRYPTAADFKAALVQYMQQRGLVVGRAQLAAFVEPLFVEERTRINKVLETQLLPAARDRTFAPTGTVPLPRMTSSGSGPVDVRESAYYEKVELEGVATTFETPGGRSQSRKRLWTVGGVAVGLALAVFGIDRIRRGFQMSAQDEAAPPPAAVAPPAAALPPTAPPSLEAEAPPPAEAVDEETEAPRASRGAGRPAARRNLAASSRRFPPESEEPPRESIPVRDRSSPTESVLGRNNRRLDDENPYGRTPSITTAPSRRNIDRANPWQAAPAPGRPTGDPR